MEIVIVVAIWTVVVKRGVEDILHTARGGTPHRYAAAKARRSSGAAGRYWGTLWDDTFEDLLSRHNEKRARRDSKPSRPEGNPRYARTALRGFGEDFGTWARQTWRDGWRRAEEKRQARRLRSQPGAQTVKGKVVPNGETPEEPAIRRWFWQRVGWKCRVCGATQNIKEVSFGKGLKKFNTGLRYCPKHMADYGPGGSKIDFGPDSPVIPNRDETQDGPQDGPRDGGQDRPQDDTGPDPRTVPTPDGGTDLQFGDDPTDPTGTKNCPECDGTGTVNGEICLRCRDRQEQRNQHHDNPSITPEGDGQGSPLTQEGNTTMTAVSAEIIGLDTALLFSEQAEQQYRAQVQSGDAMAARLAANAKAYREQAVMTDTALGSIMAAGVTGEAAARFAAAKEKSIAAAADMEEAAKHYALAMEKTGGAADDMEAAAAEFRKYLGIQEGYAAHPDAPDKQFMMAGR